jgi:hypothetical protein
MCLRGWSAHRREEADRHALSFTACRTLIDPANPEDVKQVHALQDTVKVTQPGGPGRLEVPNWDKTSQKKGRDALLVLSSTLPDLRKGGGSRDQVDPIRHVIAMAPGWGLNPDTDAIYLNVTPSRNDGKTNYTLTVPGNVPVDACWSITVYDSEGHFQKHAYDACSIDNITARKNADGSVTGRFGGCDGAIPDCLPIMKGWNPVAESADP